MPVFARKLLQQTHAIRWLTVLSLMLTISLLTACGSTKVYTADKTVVYKDTIYNVSNM